MIADYLKNLVMILVSLTIGFALLGIAAGITRLFHTYVHSLSDGAAMITTTAIALLVELPILLVVVDRLER